MTVEQEDDRPGRIKEWDIYTNLIRLDALAKNLGDVQRKNAVIDAMFYVWSFVSTSELYWFPEAGPLIVAYEHTPMDSGLRRWLVDCWTQQQYVSF